MNTQSNTSYELAVRDFQRVRREGVMQQFMARLRGHNASLLNFDDVQRAMAIGEPIYLGRQEISLDQIVGSVGRSKDFTRTFLPLNESDQARWASVRAAVMDMKGIPPIDVYKVGEIYFVNDGNHRVSVANLLKTKTITANVTEIKTRVSLTADDDIDEVIIKAGYATFLEKTNIDQRFPHVDFSMTLPGHYKDFLTEIEEECVRLSGAEDNNCLPEKWNEAVDCWVQDIYLPVVALIQELGVLEKLPDQTEADIYAQVSDRREELEAGLGWKLDRESAVPALLDSPAVNEKRLLSRILDSVAPALEAGPEVGRWRRHQLLMNRDDHLFEKMLVVFEGHEDDWKILEQVIQFSREDKDHILGLYIVEKKGELNDERVAAMRQRFTEACREAGLTSEFGVEVGRFDKVVIERSAWVDLVVVNLTDPPEPNPLARLRSTWGAIIQRSPRPLLAIPNAVQSPQDRVLLAYDGSPKADEALFIATYLTTRWKNDLTVVTVRTLNTSSEPLDEANEYIRKKHGIDWAKYVVKEGPIHTAIIETAAEHDSNLLIIGGFGYPAAVRVIRGSTVENLLREFKQPMLICR